MRIDAFLKESPLFSIYVAYDRVIGPFQKILAEENVHFLQALIITGIFFEEVPVQPSSLASTLKSSRSNISHAVRGLEKRGWIERSSRKDDARVYLLSLTKVGKKKAGRLIKLFDDTQERLELAGAAEVNRGLTEFLNRV